MTTEEAERGGSEGFTRQNINRINNFRGVHGGHVFKNELVVPGTGVAYESMT